MGMGPGGMQDPINALQNLTKTGMGPQGKVSGSENILQHWKYPVIKQIWKCPGKILDFVLERESRGCC